MSIPAESFAPQAYNRQASVELPVVVKTPLLTAAVILPGTVVLLLLGFVFLGPQIWTQDPTQQWLSQISQGPVGSRYARVVDEQKVWQPVNEVAKLVAVDAHTEYVRLQWPELETSRRFQLYRNIASETGLGLPLTHTQQPYYEDKLQLASVLYRYSVLDADTGLLLFAVDVRPTMAISRFVAQLQQLELEAGTDGSNWVTLPAHPLGTDALGRDILARVMVGGQTSLFVGILAPLLFITLGCIYGAVSGLLGGWFDQMAMRFVDFVVALPFLLFMILFRVAFGIGPGENGILPLILAMLALSWPSSARLIRGQVLALREQAFVDAAKLAGVSYARLVFQHILPNVLPLILVAFSFAIPQAIFTEAFLSFIGMGVSPPTTSWGALCNDGIKTLLSHPRQLIIPALFISVAVLAFNLLGDALRDATDRRSGAATA